ncbi:MAG: hypothetical protein Q7S31_02390 [bacterium]|nr:hypothetical protein [bacterium]
MAKFPLRPNHEQLARERFGKRFRDLTEEGKKEILGDISTGFLEGDTKAPVITDPGIVSKEPRKEGRAGQEVRREGKTIRRIPPHAHGKDVSLHLPIEGGN